MQQKLSTIENSIFKRPLSKARLLYKANKVELKIPAKNT